MKWRHERNQDRHQDRHLSLRHVASHWISTAILRSEKKITKIRDTFYLWILNIFNQKKKKMNNQKIKFFLKKKLKYFFSTISKTCSVWIVSAVPEWSGLDCDGLETVLRSQASRPNEDNSFACKHWIIWTWTINRLID